MNSLGMALLAAGIAIVMATNISLAAEQSTTVKGTLSVTKDDGGNCTVVIKDEHGAKYVLVPGEKRQELEKLNQKAVEITGALSSKENTRTLTVQEYRQV